MQSPSKLVSIFAGIYVGFMLGFCGVLLIPRFLIYFFNYHMSLEIVLFFILAFGGMIFAIPSFVTFFLKLANSGNNKEWERTVISYVVLASIVMLVFFSGHG
ncbi:MAG: hypothetical protein A2787_09690 [Omnitrophica WOR_2 bacterium RIFCSPHIGHO2_01_FULL_48_9]|nr:MAG: hypothetical protein A3D10_07235 [Omnitrophica WOR_2 bacterium RIFCSPHIGHO2_02_FULL_48_11]OGX30007.1 MAG: hypothetical protein A2787_09690 [Omnitrophica WOR_2 bacterium RIFCSPHIGHO2_01_FULL_48_9]